MVYDSASITIQGLSFWLQQVWCLSFWLQQVFVHCLTVQVFHHDLELCNVVVFYEAWSLSWLAYMLILKLILSICYEVDNGMVLMWLCSIVVWQFAHGAVLDILSWTMICGLGTCCLLGVRSHICIANFALLWQGHDICQCWYDLDHLALSWKVFHGSEFGCTGLQHADIMQGHIML